MIKKIGFHTGDGWFQYLDLIKRWQPPVVTILSPNKDQVKQLRAVCPNTVIVGRIYVQDSTGNSELFRDPKQFAHATHVTILDYNIPEVDYWVMSNEPTPYWDWLPKIDEYNLELMKLADSSGYKVGIYSVSVGNFDLPKDNPMAYWDQLAKSLKYADANKHAVLVHQYQKPNLINNNEDDNWLIFRLEKQVLPNLKQYPNLKFIISEIGVDHLINNGTVGGFQKTLNDQQYFDQLLQWEKFEQDYPQVLGGCIFMLGSQNPWESYSIINNSKVAQMLADHYANTNYDGEKPDMTETIYIPQVNKEDETPVITPVDVKWDENLTKRGVVLKPYVPTKDGEVYYKLIEATYLGENKEHIFVDIQGIDGSLITDSPVEFYWDGDKTIRKTKDISKDKYALGAVDFDMHAHGNSYGVRIPGVASDDVWGMGLGSIDKPDWNIHVSYKLVFKRVVYKADSKPVKKPTKPKPVESTPTPTPISVPSQGDSKSFRGRVTAAVLNVRSAPQMGDNVVRQLGNGAVVEVTDHTGNDGWYQIGVNEWVADQWVEAYQTEDEVVDSLLANFSRIYRIDETVVRATFAIESGGLAFGPFGKAMIRFENHIFFMKLDNPDLYYRNFKNNGNDVNSHLFRRTENSEWIQFHGDQKLEWEVFEFAKTVNKDAAEQSISIGMGQIMGFNYTNVGYASAARMIEAFSQNNLSGVISQVCAFFAYCVNKPGAIEYLRNKDWENFALAYNGARSYGELLENQYNKMK